MPEEQYIQIDVLYRKESKTLTIKKKKKDFKTKSVFMAKIHRT